jgi:hypothetical protein
VCDDNNWAGTDVGRVGHVIGRVLSAISYQPINKPTLASFVRGTIVALGLAAK